MQGIVTDPSSFTSVPRPTLPLGHRHLPRAAPMRNSACDAGARIDPRIGSTGTILLNRMPPYTHGRGCLATRPLLPSKPKWTRRRTYQRIRNEIQALEAQAKQTRFRKDIDIRTFAYHAA